MQPKKLWKHYMSISKNIDVVAETMYDMPLPFQQGQREQLEALRKYIKVVRSVLYQKYVIAS